MPLQPRLTLLTSLLALGALGLLATPAAADKLPDPPSATIVSPEDGAVFDTVPTIIQVTLDVFVGPGIDSIALQVDSETVATNEMAPWDFEGVELSEGMHTLQVVVMDNDGIGYPSNSVSVAVIADEGTGDTSDSTDSTGTADSGTADSDTADSGTADSGTDTKDCSCTSPEGEFGGLLGFGLVGLAVLGMTRRES